MVWHIEARLLALRDDELAQGVAPFSEGIGEHEVRADVERAFNGDLPQDLKIGGEPLESGHAPHCR